MPRHSTPQDIRRQAYQTVLATPAGREVLKDLVRFGQEQGISEQRLLGRADVALRFLDEQAKAREPEPEEEISE